jgi:uncharacterized Tic20 family protein
MNEIGGSGKRKLLSVLCHGANFFSALFISIGIPIVILFISDDPIVKENAKESLNFHFNVWFYQAIYAVLIAILIGYLLLPLVPIFILFTWILPIIAVVKVLGNPDTAFRYPFIFRIL